MASSAEWTRTVKYADGESDVQHLRYRFINGDFAPDFLNLKAFIPNFHEGARVQIEGDQAPIPLRWHLGHVEPAVDDALRAKLDKEVQDALKEKSQP
jgi:hypothetical protein